MATSESSAQGGHGNTGPHSPMPAMFGQQQPDVPTAPSASDIQVAPEKLLDVAGVIEEQAGQLMRKISEHLDALTVEPPSEDVVSVNAVDGWNTVVAGGEGSYHQQALAYVRQLRALADQLRAASEKYTVSEEDKRETFDDRRGFTI